MVEIDGYFTVSKSGDYTVDVDTKGAAVLHLHQALVVDTDKPGKVGEMNSGTITLAAGTHPFRLRYLTDGAPAALAVTGAGEVTF